MRVSKPLQELLDAHGNPFTAEQVEEAAATIGFMVEREGRYLVSLKGGPWGFNDPLNLEPRWYEDRFTNLLGLVKHCRFR